MRNGVSELLERVRPFRLEPNVGSVLFLLDKYIEVWKEDLVNAKGDDVIKLQGAINKVRGILLEIRRQENTHEYKNGAYSGD